METLFMQLQTLQELFMLKGVMLDNEFDDRDRYEISNVSKELLDANESKIYSLHDSREQLLCRINSVKNEIVLQATRMQEVCILDFAESRKIETFSAQLSIRDRE